MENITTANTADAMQAAALLDQAMVLLTGLRGVKDPETRKAIRALWNKTATAANDADALAQGMRAATGDGVREFKIAE